MSEWSRDNWQSFGEIADRLLRKCEQQINERHFEAAETYHALWIDEVIRRELDEGRK